MIQQTQCFATLGGAMVKTMVPMKNYPKVLIPKLHSVVVREGEIFTKKEYDEIYEWCRNNCKEQFYIYPSWTLKVGVDFEDDEDAIMFTLRFK